MIGTFLNTAGILLGGILGLTWAKPLSAANQNFFRIAIAVFTVFYGLRLTWISINGSFLQVGRQLLITLLALMLGKLLGRLLRLQKLSNELGRRAREAMASVKPGVRPPPSLGFNVCAALFCAAPLGWLGAIQDGISQPPYFYPLAVKAVFDGLAAMGFVAMFGWSVLVSALPVFAVQGTITLASLRFLKPFLEAHSLVDPVNAVGGLLVFCVALLMLELKKIEIADYLPSLAIAPLIASIWH